MERKPKNSRIRAVDSVEGTVLGSQHGEVQRVDADIARIAHIAIVVTLEVIE